MKFNRTIFASLAVLLLATLAVAQDRSSGTLKGKVKVEVGTPAGVAVIVKHGEREVGQTVTDKNGEFVTRVPPGVYDLTFRKPGLSVGTIEKVEVKAGKTRSLGDRLVLTIDEGSIAFIRGSVFNHAGLSVRGARVELARIQEDGSARKIDGRITNETGSFVFRLMPDTAKYRLTARLSGTDAVSKDIEIDGPAVYRLALSLPATPK